MKSTRKFYRTIVKLEVLSERPLDGMDIHKIASECEEGNFAGKRLENEVKELDGPAMVKALTELEVPKDLEFFQLTEDGEDTE